MTDKNDRPPGLTMEFMRQCCWAGDDRTKWCRYVRIQKGSFTCAKGTAAGLRHSARIDEMLAEEAAAAPVVVFDSGSDLAPPDNGEPKICVHAGDNCPGRADEFVSLRHKHELS